MRARRFCSRVDEDQARRMQQQAESLRQSRVDHFGLRFPVRSRILSKMRSDTQRIRRESDNG